MRGLRAHLCIFLLLLVLLYADLVVAQSTPPLEEIWPQWLLDPEDFGSALVQEQMAHLVSLIAKHDSVTKLIKPLDHASCRWSAASAVPLVRKYASRYGIS